MLNESRIYNFIDNKNAFSLHFFDGQNLVVNLAQIHALQGSSFSYYRDTVLGSTHIINYLKNGESIGFYVDSENPPFNFKIELNHTGTLRTLLMPEIFSFFPERITGKVRLTKMNPNTKQPYTSIIDVQDEKASLLINSIFEKSYQTQCTLIVSETSDQSILVRKLPRIDVNKDESFEETISLNDYMVDNKIKFEEIFSKAHNGVEPVVKDFESLGYTYLLSKEIKFHCPCSKEQMAYHIGNLSDLDKKDIFKDGPAEITCDYCRVDYSIIEEDTLTQIN